MKKLILIIITLTLLFSCNDNITKLEPGRQETITTQEIINASIKDSTLYKIVTIDNSLYAINTKTNLVEFRVFNLDNLILLLFITLCCLFIILILIA